MKLINYKRGYSNTFNCSIHGTIVLTSHEWQDALNWFKRVRNPFKYYDDGTFFKKLFFEDIKKAIVTAKAKYINIRVPLTESLVARYNLKGYKRGNYQLCILH